MLWLPCVGSVKMVDTCLLAKRSLDLHGGGNPRTAISNPYHYIAVQYFWNDRNLTQFMSTGELAAVSQPNGQTILGSTHLPRAVLCKV